jgi:hypothetical protein
MNVPTDTLLIRTQLVVTAAMTGIIWMVQCVAYPQFLDVGADAFPAFHSHYTAGITPIVVPLMILELGLALASAWRFRRSALRLAMFAGALLAGALWLTTGLVQVPQHEALAGGWSEPVIRSLIAGNWIRTILWSVRLGILFRAGMRPLPVGS